VGAIIFYNCLCSASPTPDISKSNRPIFCTQQKWGGANYLGFDLRAIKARVTETNDEITVWSDNDLLSGSIQKGIARLESTKISDTMLGVYDFEFFNQINISPDAQSERKRSQSGNPVLIN
jgi:hypothetical protein